MDTEKFEAGAERWAADVKDRAHRWAAERAAADVRDSADRYRDYAERWADRQRRRAERRRARYARRYGGRDAEQGTCSDNASSFRSGPEDRLRVGLEGLAAEMKALTERIAVLEKLATDPETRLSEDIERLRSVRTSPPGDPKI